jgi:hypothetical protein
MGHRFNMFVQVTLREKADQSQEREQAVWLVAELEGMHVPNAEAFYFARNCLGTGQ